MLLLLFYTIAHIEVHIATSEKTYSHIIAIILIAGSRSISIISIFTSLRVHVLSNGSTVIIVIRQPYAISLLDDLSAHWVLLLLPHPEQLFLEKLHLVSVIVPYNIDFPFFVLSALFASLTEQIEAANLLHSLYLVIDVELAGFFWLLLCLRQVF